MRAALGLVEAIGLTTAITALDAAGKAADVKLVGYEKVIGAGKAVSVTVHIAGEVAAVKASVEAAVAAASKVGTVLSHHVIPRPHEEVDLIIQAFEKKAKKKIVKEQPKESKTKQNKQSKNKKKEE
ncbi:BMC domain-containing protein [Natronincola peptidivorans]|uniref:BMC domain-containing protein n=1 Tax=Natronincola peptidivorans TaxID=426128 RepID=A0A1I0F423_9FIRM|nr:BMC domain-containing protein [Natronincola peptidivorans]SET52782.1 BMC domain-containing protein [Natronincola peptidivorans]